jgi:hypothetical protein
MSHRGRSSARRATAAALVRVALTMGLVLASGSSMAAPESRPRFASGEEAATALVDAVRAADKTAMLRILGPEAGPLISSGDDVADRRSRERFVRAYEDGHRLVPAGPDKLVLTVGKDEWPMPIPLVRDAGGWWFDTGQGKEEILNRRVGRNELHAIQVCLAYVDAQREYYVRAPNGDGGLQYAQRFKSSAGKRDGLYWETQPGEALSPLGPLVAQAQGEGYPTKRSGAGPTPYWGYYYRILKAQGPHARGGAYDYVVRGRMIGGFSLVAYPAQWGSSGVKTFMVNHDGIVYEKDLGPDTAAIARAMIRFDPDASWTKR